MLRRWREPEHSSTDSCDVLVLPADPGFKLNVSMLLRLNMFQLTVWVLCRALDVLEQLSELRRAELAVQLDLSTEEIARWEDISRRIFVPFHDDAQLLRASSATA